MDWEPSNSWEFGVLGLYDWTNPEGKLAPFFGKLEKIQNKGAVVEFGVYRGSTFLSIALFLRQRGIKNEILGFDTFSGFPSRTHPKDSWGQFQTLAKTKAIDIRHLERVKLNKILLELRENEKITSAIESSNSGDFSDTSRLMVEEKANRLGIENIRLVEGDFQSRLDEFSHNHPNFSITAANLDSDTYESYKLILNFLDKHMIKGGFAFLDEYYSLKFPGPRTAVIEFMKSNADRYSLEKYTTGRDQEWERTILTKVSL